MWIAAGPLVIKVKATWFFSSSNNNNIKHVVIKASLIGVIYRVLKT